MKVNVQRERSFYKIELDKYNKRKYLKSENKSLNKEETKTRLTSINSDIEKLYKKYSEIKKERLTKEKSQQILVNRLNFLRNEAKRSVSKNENPKNIKKIIDDKNKKIFVKINSKYKFNRIIKRHKNSENIISNELLYIDNDSLSKTSFNGNESEIIGNSFNKSSLNSKKKVNNSNLIGEKENNQNENNSIDLNKNNLNNIEDFIKKYKYNIGNKNSNNNIYIIINNPNTSSNDKTSNNNLNNNSNNCVNINFTPKNDNIKNENNKKNNSDDNNIIDIAEEGENIILMNANGRKLQDIINSINNLNNKNIVKNKNDKNKNNNDINKNNSENNIKKEKEKVNNNDKNKDNNENKKEDNIIENNKKDKEEEKIDKNNIILNKNDKNDDNNNNNNIDEIKKEEKKEAFVRPNFLNLYKNEENCGTNQKIDINSYGETNRVENKNIQLKENLILDDKKENKRIFNQNRIKLYENENEKEEIKKDKKTDNSNFIKKCVINQNKNINSLNKVNNIFNSGISTISSCSSGKKRKKRKQISDNNLNDKNSLNEFEESYIKNNTNANNTVSVDNFEYFKLYKSVITENKDKKATPEKLNKKIDINKNNILNEKEINNNLIDNQKKNIIYEGNKNIKFSLSKIDLNDNNKNIFKKKKNNIEKRKNYLRRDSYCTSIEKKRKALGLEFKPNFKRELSIQTSKNNKNKITLGKRIKNNITIENDDIKSMNIYESLFNKKKKKNIIYNDDRLIKVRKRDENKEEKKYKFLKKNIDKEKNSHQFLKNKTSLDFNYNNKNSFNNNIKSELKDLRNRKIRYKKNSNLDLDNDNVTNKTSDSCFYSLVNKIINGTK